MLVDLIHRLRALFRRTAVERDLDEELRFHVDRQVETYQRAGHDHAEAVRRARLDLGGLDQVREEYRDSLGVRLIQDVRRDVQLAGRMLKRQPGFAAASMLTLALGIGATAAVFSLLDVLLLRPLPVRDPHELAHIYTSCRAGDTYCVSSYPEFLAYRSQNRTFADMAAFDEFEVNVGDDAGSWVGAGSLVSTNYFSLLGVAPHSGRLFSSDWNVAADPPVVLAYDAWITRFGGDSSVIGQTLRLSGTAFRIAGVAPAGFHGTRLDVRPSLWVPIENVALLPVAAGRDLLGARDIRWIEGTIGRLNAGATIAQAHADLRAVSDRLQQLDPGREDRFVTIEAARRAALPPTIAGDITRFVLLLMGGVTLTLLIGCANVAGLLVARSAARRPEIALRRALGASRGRLVRQLATEYALLALAGTVVGLFVAHWVVSLLAAYELPGALPVNSLDLSLNSRVLAFATLLLVVTGSFGLWPAVRTTRGLSLADRRTIGTDGQHALLAIQVAVTLVLLVGAGLFIRSLQHGLALDLGVGRHPVVMAQVAPVLLGYPPDHTRGLITEAVVRLTALPGVTGATAANRPPLTGGSGFRAQTIDGYSPRPTEEMRFESHFVAPDYFKVLGIALRAGREFTHADIEAAPPVAVISQSMARRYWAGRNPLDTHLHSRSFPGAIRIVGVADDVAVGLDGTAEPFVYMPLRQNPRFLSAPIPVVLLARVDSDATALAASLRGALRDIDPSLPVTAITTLEARIADLLMPQRLGSLLLSGLAGLTTILVIVGVVGTVGYGIARRRREIGLRLALGARRSDVVRALTRGAVVWVAVGVLAGLGGAVALGRLASTFLYGITPTDSPTLAAAVAILLVAAGAASFLPAWRAAGMDPAEVLKRD
jgi:putative ABC transport system permease protein